MNAVGCQLLARTGCLARSALDDPRTSDLERLAPASISSFAARVAICGSPPVAGRSEQASEFPVEASPLVPFSRDGVTARPVLIAAVHGLVGAELQRVAASMRVGTTMGPDRVHVVFLTDLPEIATLRREGVLVEYLPPRPELERLAADPAEVDLYLARRLEILCRKWGPARIVAYGPEATDWMSRLVASLKAPRSAR